MKNGPEIYEAFSQVRESPACSCGEWCQRMMSSVAHSTWRWEGGQKTI